MTPETRCDMVISPEIQRSERYAVKILVFPQLKAVKGIPYSRMQLWRLEKVGRFPTRIRFSRNRIGWPEGEVDAWLGTKIAERDAAKAA